MDIDHSPAPSLPDAPGVDLLELLSDINPGAVRVHVAHLRAGAVLPWHRAGLDQYFHVLSGEGRAAGDDGVLVSIHPGDTVHWHAGEHHSTTADTELTAVIVQTDL